MLDEASIAAATAAGAAVAAAAATEQWAAVRAHAAHLLGKGDPGAEQEHLNRLEAGASAVKGARGGNEPRIRLETALQTRFELLLEETAGAERHESVERLLDLVRLGRNAYATVAVPALVDAYASGGDGVAPAKLVGEVPRGADPFHLRPEALERVGWGPVQVFTGPAGTGKTQLAAHLTRQTLRDGSADLVVWVDAASTDALICAYADAAAATTEHDPSQPERCAEAFRSWLSWTDRRWLVVLDGVPDTAELRDLWPPARPNGRVLVTARRAAYLPDTAVRVEIGPYLPMEAAGHLMREIAEDGRADEPAEVMALASDLRQHPLALSTAAAVMAHSGLTCAAYRDRLSGTVGPAGAPTVRDAVTAGWWAAIGTADLQCGGLARPLLELAAVLDPHGVPVAVLTSPPALHHLARRRSHGDSGAPLPVETRDVVDAIEVMHRLRLVEDEHDANRPTVRMSTLVQSAVLGAVPAETWHDVVLSTADALRTVWRTASDEPRSELCRALRSGADVLTGHAREILWRPHCHPLLFQVGRNLIEAGLIRAARIRWDWLHSRLHLRFGPDHPDTLAARGYQARVRGASQDAAGAVAAYRDLLDDLERVLGTANPDVLVVRDNLALWQGMSGDPAGAAASYTGLLADRLLLLGPAHRDTLLTRHNLALWRGRAGDAAGAAAAYAELLDDMGRAFEANDPAVVEIRDQLTEWRSKAADAAAASRAAADPARHPERIDAGQWSPSAADTEDRSPEASPLSAQRLLLEPSWHARLLRRIARPDVREGAGAPPVGRDGPPASGCHRVSVISLKGGTGKTTTAVALGATLAGMRGGPVIAVDASPEGGTLGHRVRPTRSGGSLRDLLSALPGLDGHDDFLPFTTAGPNGLEVLARDVAPTLSMPFGAQQYRRVVDSLSRAYPVVITDSGTGLMQETMRSVLALTDQLVVVATASVDGASVADVTLDWLSHHGHAELARGALVVLSEVHAGTPLVRTDRIVEHFARRCRTVVTVPFDEHLATGAELDLSRLRAETRRSYLTLAELVEAGVRRAPAGQAERGYPAEPDDEIPAPGPDVPPVPIAQSRAVPEPAPAPAPPPARPAEDAEPVAAPRSGAGPAPGPAAYGPTGPPGAASPLLPGPRGGRRPRPPRSARLTVTDDVVRIGTPTTVEFTLAVTDPHASDLDRTEPVSVLVVATPRSPASLEPVEAVYATNDAQPARFTFTAWEAGEHRLRFRLYAPGHGRVLQVVEATLPVAAAQPPGGP